MGGAHLRCASWTAVSSEPQSEKESLHDQRRLNHEFINNIGRFYPGYTAEVVADLQVIGSRSIVDVADAAAAYPDAYGELLRLLRTRSIDAVICRSRDRLGRIDSLIVTIERLCWQHGAVVIPRQSLPTTLSAAEMRDSEGAGLISAIEAHQARSAVRRISNEQEMGMAARVKRGNFANIVPWGYKLVYASSGEKRIEIDPSAAEILRYILLELYVGQRLGAPTIVKILNAAGHVAPSGKPWTGSSLWEITANADRYAGYVHINRRSPKGRQPVEARGNHAAIISEDELASVQAEFKRRGRTEPLRRGLLKGVIICSVTGKPMAYVYSHGHGSYYCSHCKRAGLQPHSFGEQKAWSLIRSTLEELETVADSEQVFALRIRPRIEQLQGQRDELQQSLTKAEARRKRLLHIYLHKEAMTEISFDAEMNKVSMEIVKSQNALAAIERQITEMQDSITLKKRLGLLSRARQEILSKRETDPEGLREFLLQSFRIYVSAGERRDTGARTKIDRIDVL